MTNIEKSRELLWNKLNHYYGFQVREITKSEWEVCSGGDVTIIKVHAYRNGNEATYKIININGINF